MPNQYEILVTRKVTNRFVVDARTGAEAAMRLGALLSRDDPWEGSTETETGRQMRAPALVRAEPETLALHPDGRPAIVRHAMRREAEASTALDHDERAQTISLAPEEPPQ